jgi:hypothetical protein
VAFAFLPHLAWHNALWGFQSQVYFSLGFSVLALGWLGAEGVAGWRRWAGLAAGGAGLFAMGGAALVPVALIGLVVLRTVERRGWTRERWLELWPALVLLGAAVALRVEVPEHAALRAQSVGPWAETFLRALAWPQAWQPLAALGLNAPLAWVVVARVLGKRRAVAGEDFVVVLCGWSVAMAGAMAWSRGASGEFAGAVPSRYADFLVLLPLANAWCAVVLVREARAKAGAGGGSGASEGEALSGRGRSGGGRMIAVIAAGVGDFFGSGMGGAVGGNDAGDHFAADAGPRSAGATGGGVSAKWGCSGICGAAAVAGAASEPGVGARGAGGSAAARGVAAVVASRAADGAAVARRAVAFGARQWGGGDGQVGDGKGNADLR